jgi:Dimerisation domain
LPLDFESDLGNARNKHRHEIKGEKMSDQSSQLPQDSAGSQMHQLIFGFIALPAIAAAAKLGIADLVGQSPKTVDELADATKAHALSLRRLLQFLAGLGIFAEDAAGSTVKPL